MSDRWREEYSMMQRIRMPEIDRLIQEEVELKDRLKYVQDRIAKIKEENK